MPDLEFVCRDCGAGFAFTEAEQEHFRAQGFAHPPKRCRDCRAKNRRRAPRGPDAGTRPQAAPHEVPHAGDRPAAPAGHAPEPAPPRPRGPMHATTCSLCTAPTEVPFVPDGVRPVFCLPCLKKQTR